MSASHTLAIVDGKQVQADASVAIDEVAKFRHRDTAIMFYKMPQEPQPATRDEFVVHVAIVHGKDLALLDQVAEDGSHLLGPKSESGVDVVFDLRKRKYAHASAGEELSRETHCLAQPSRVFRNKGGEHVAAAVGLPQDASPDQAHQKRLRQRTGCGRGQSKLAGDLQRHDPTGSQGIVAMVLGHAPAGGFQQSAVGRTTMKIELAVDLSARHFLPTREAEHHFPDSGFGASDGVGDLACFARGNPFLSL